MNTKDQLQETARQLREHLAALLKRLPLDELSRALRASGLLPGDVEHISDRYEMVQYLFQSGENLAKRLDDERVAQKAAAKNTTPRKTKRKR